MERSIWQKLRSLLDLNKNGKVELWEFAVFSVGFVVAGAVISSLL